jgi:hypothetical protein
MASKRLAYEGSFAGRGMDKAFQKTAWNLAAARTKRTKPLMTLREARRRLKDEPIGSAIQLGPGSYLKKTGKDKYNITSLQ